MSYYFDTLPLHPQPKCLESFTSYLIRLAEANHIWRPRTFSLLFWGRPGFLIRSADHPPHSFGRLPMAAACAETSLLSTTFYHLNKKFDGANNPRATARFLNGSLSRSLRYCPKCIGERSFYSLLWSFLCLSGCSDHGCRLLDRCEHCRQDIPLFGTPLKIGFCPQCKGDLRTCHTNPLTLSEASIAKARSQDLAFLVTPQPWENAVPHVFGALGWQFTYRRRKMGLSLPDIDSRIGDRTKIARFLEHGTGQEESARRPLRLRFERYLEYADLLGVSLSEMFIEALAQKAKTETLDTNNQYPQKQQNLNQAIGNHQVEAAVQTLSTASLRAPYYYRERRNYNERQRYEEALLVEVHHAIYQLKKHRQPVTEKAVAEFVHSSVPHLRSQRSVKVLLDQVCR